MAVELTTAYVSIVPSFKGSQAAIAKGIGAPASAAGESAGAEAGKRFSGKFALAAKVGLLGAAAGVALFAKGAISAASDVNEAQSKVGVVFGKQAKQIIAASKTSAAAMGLSSGAYLDATGTLGNLLVSLNIAPKAAADMSQQMVKLAGDLASFNNVSPEEALAAIKSGLTGETEPLKAFGVNMNDATLHAQALKLGLIKNVKDGLSPQAKALAAQALIMDQTKTAQGDFARTSGGLANQQRILAAQFQDVKAKVGAALLPVMVKLAKFATSVLLPALAGIWKMLQDNLGPIFTQARYGILGFVSAFKGEGITSGGFIGAMEHVGVVVRKVVDFLVSHRDAVKKFAIAVGGVTAAWLLLNIVMSVNPIVLAVTAIAALVAALVVAYQKSETFRRVVQTVFDGIKQFVAFVVASWPQIKAAFVTAWNAIRPTLQALGDLLKTIWVSVLQPIVAWVVAHWSQISTVIKVVFIAVAIAAGIMLVALRVAFRLLAVAIQVLAAVFSWLWRNIVVPVFKGIKAEVGANIAVVRAILSAMSTAVRAVGTVVSTVGHTIGAVFRGIGNGLSTGYDTVRRIIGNILTIVRGLPGKITSSLSHMWDVVHDSFVAAVNALIRGWNSLQFKIPGFDPPGPGPKFGGFTLGVPDIPELRAKGGPVVAGMPYIVGEKRPELFVPNRSGRIESHVPARGGSGNSYHFYEAHSTAQIFSEIDRREWMAGAV